MVVSEKQSKEQNKCKHEHQISRGDAGMCLDCGWVATVLGNEYYSGEQRKLVELFFEGKITREELDRGAQKNDI